MCKEKKLTRNSEGDKEINIFNYDPDILHVRTGPLKQLRVFIIKKEFRLLTAWNLQ